MRKFLLAILLLALSGSPADAQVTLTEITVLGRGSAQTLDWRSDGEILAVGGSAGVWLFDSEYQQIMLHPHSSVSRVRFSPDGRYLAVSDSQNMTEIWQLDTDGRLLERSDPIPVSGYWMRWSPDSRSIMEIHAIWDSGEYRETQIHIWDIATGEISLTIAGLDGFANVIWSPDGASIAGATRSGTINIWDVITGDVVNTFVVSEDLIETGLYELTGIAYQEDASGLYLIFLSSRALWSLDFDSGEFMMVDIEFRYAEYGLEGLERQPNGENYIVESGRGQVYVMRLGSEPMTVRGGSHVVDYAWLPGENHLSLVGFSGKIWESGSQGEATQEYQLFMPNGTLTYSPDSRWLLYSTGRNPYDFNFPLMVWDLDEPDTIAYDPTRLMYPYLSAKWNWWMPDSERIWVFSDNSVPHALCLTYSMEEWNIITDTVTYLYEEGACGIMNVPDIQFEYVADWTSDMSIIASAHRNRVSVSGYLSASDTTAAFEAETRVASLRWSPDDSDLLVIGSDYETSESSVEVWDVATETRQMLFSTTQTVSQTQWSPVSDAISVITWDNDTYTLQVFDAESGDVRFERSIASLPQVDWKPDGTQLAIGNNQDESGTLTIIDAQTGQEIHTIEDEWIAGLSWHPTQDWLAYGTGTELTVFDVPAQSVVASVAFSGAVHSWSPDGTRIATTRAGRIHIWEVNLDS